MIARTGLLLTIALVVLIVLGAREFSVASDAPLSSTEALEAPAAAVTGVAPGMPGVSKVSVVEPTDDGDPVDLYGNEVTAAVATYKLDSTGALYELHSPQTEVPQLAAPQS